MASGIGVEVFEEAGVKLVPAAAGNAGTASLSGRVGAWAFEYIHGWMGEGHDSLDGLKVWYGGSKVDTAG